MASIHLFCAPFETEALALPLFLERCQAGFPSPAQDYVEAELDLNDYCVWHRNATFYVRANGDSMTDIGIRSGDVLVVDRAEKPQHGDIVIAAVGNEFTVKQLLLRPRLALQPMNPDYPPQYPDPDDLQIFGVVTHSIHRLKERR
ncbi:translesion error-prone DNA polymerase V autoproteolytic subunit (plasmid) [Franconibacter pulveris]